MTKKRALWLLALACACLLLLRLVGYKGRPVYLASATVDEESVKRTAVAQPPFMSTMASAPPQGSDDAVAPDKTGGFDGKRAYALVAKQVEFGPRPSGTPAIARLQDFLQSELKSYGCVVEADDFHADTLIGRLPM